MKTQAIITLRVSYRDWIKVRKVLPAERNETVIHYFMRLTKWAKEQNDM